MSAEEVRAAIAAAMPPAEPEEAPARPPRQGQRDKVIEVGLEAELWRDPDDTAYATVEVDGHREHHAVRDTRFRRWLLRRFGERFRRATANGGARPTAPGAQALSEALAALEAQAMEGPTHEPAVRVRRIGERVYVDRGDAAWSAIEVDANGWRNAPSCPVKFARPQGLRPLPEPIRGGSIDRLKPFLNLKTGSDFMLTVGWLVAALSGAGPFPILVVNAEQGAGKSTLCRVLRRLVDPNKAEVRSAPNGERDLILAARNGWLIALDNLSYVGGDLSDALCRVATGAGFATRALYTNDEEFIVSVCRPQLLNGIPDLAERPDLANRSIVLLLPTLPDAARRTEAAFWAAFDAAAPQLLGALLDGVATALRRAPAIELPSLPRMADFAVWAEAAGPAFGWAPGSFVTAYEDNLTGAMQATVEADPLSEAVAKLMEAEGHWKGSASELLERLNQLRPDGQRPPRSWPADATRLSSKLRRALPGLRRLGIAADLRRVRGRSRIDLWTMPQDSATSATSATDPAGAVPFGRVGSSAEARGGGADPPAGCADQARSATAPNGRAGGDGAAFGELGGAGSADPGGAPKWEQLI